MSKKSQLSEYFCILPYSYHEKLVFAKIHSTPFPSILIHYSTFLTCFRVKFEFAKEPLISFSPDIAVSTRIAKKSHALTQ